MQGSPLAATAGEQGEGAVAAHCKTGLAQPTTQGSVGSAWSKQSETWQLRVWVLGPETPYTRLAQRAQPMACRARACADGATGDTAVPCAQLVLNDLAMQKSLAEAGGLTIGLLVDGLAGTSACNGTSAVRLRGLACGEHRVECRAGSQAMAFDIFEWFDWCASGGVGLQCRPWAHADRGRCCKGACKCHAVEDSTSTHANPPASSARRRPPPAPGGGSIAPFSAAGSRSLGSGEAGAFMALPWARFLGTICLPWPAGGRGKG